MSDEKYTIAENRDDNGKDIVQIKDEWGTEVLFVSLNGWQFTGVQLTDKTIDLLEKTIADYRAVKQQQLAKKKIEKLSK